MSRTPSTSSICYQIWQSRPPGTLAPLLSLVFTYISPPITKNNMLFSATHHVFAYTVVSGLEWSPFLCHLSTCSWLTQLLTVVSKASYSRKCLSHPFLMNVPILCFPTASAWLSSFAHSSITHSILLSITQQSTCLSSPRKAHMGDAQDKQESRLTASLDPKAWMSQTLKRNAEMKWNLQGIYSK